MKPYTKKLLSNMQNNWKDKEPLWYPSLSVPTKHASARNLDIGWALKVTGPRRTRFTVAQRSYLTKKFKLGEMTGQKADPASVARSMMHAKDINGTRMFQ